MPSLPTPLGAGTWPLQVLLAGIPTLCSKTSEKRASDSWWHLASLFKHLGHRYAQLINVLSAVHLPAG